MKSNHFILFLLSVCFMVFLPGCGDDPVSEDRLDDAMTRLENSMDKMINCEEEDPFECGAYFSQANEMFKETMIGATDTTRIRTANMGAAMTEILQLNEDNEIKSIKNRFQDYFDTASIFHKTARAGVPNRSASKSSFLQFRLNPFSAQSLNTSHQEMIEQFKPVLKVALANPPLISEVQSVIRRKVIPAIDYAIARMEFIEQDSAFVFMVSPKMQGDMDEDTREMDMTEFKAFHGALLTMRATFKIFNAYNLDVPNYTIESIAQTLNPGSDFLTLNSVNDLATARTDMMVAADTLIGAIRFLRSETDNQDNDIIKIDINNLDPGDLDEIESRLNDIKLGFIQNTVIHDVNDYGDSVVVSLSNFFTSPIQDFKAMMPDYRVLVVSNDCGKDLRWKFNSTTFPYPHFNGIFPDINTSNDLKRIFDIDLDTVGYETMSAQINGLNWNSCDAWGDGYSNYLDIGGERYLDNETTYINDHSGISIYNFAGAGTYQLGGTSGNEAFHCIHTMTSYNWFGTDETHTGTLTVTRYDDQVIQGTFSFTGYNSNSATTKSVTNGTFYVKNEEGLNKSLKKNNNAKGTCVPKK